MELRTEMSERDSVQAATWVWESLWSTRRHARVSILDVALFKKQGDKTLPSTSPTVARWLFTAKNGRVMKKTGNKANLGALKQALLGKVLRGASEDDEDSEGLVFAMALLSSGQIVPLNEDAWGALMVNAGRQDDVTAIIALVPGDPEGVCCGARQRFTCKYKAAYDSTRNVEVDGISSVPIKPSMKTYVLVSPCLLRETHGNNEPRDQGKERLRRGKSDLDGRLVSRVKAVNQEVEANLCRIVQWVQEVRTVRVQSMTAIFTVLLSVGIGTPRVWLERVLDVQVVPKGGTTAAAPTAGPECLTPIQVDPEHHSRENDMADMSMRNGGKGAKERDRLTGSTSQPSNDIVRYRQTNNVKNIQDKATATLPIEEIVGMIPPASTSGIALTLVTASSAGSLGQEMLSTEEMLSTAANGAALLCEREEGGSGVQVNDGRREGILLAAKCVGDFCTCQEPSELQQPRQKQKEITKLFKEKVLDWTDVEVSGGKEGLLELAKQRILLENREGDMLFSLTYKSVCMARIEANRGGHLFWGDHVRKCWQGGNHRLSDLEELRPVELYREVIVCRTCYDVYRRLDKLREDLDRRGVRRCSCSNATAKIGATALAGRRAAAEVSAVTLSAEVTAMLKDVDARAGKLGVEAGIPWRRRLSKTKSNGGIELASTQSQALFMHRLARPKPQAHIDVDSTPPKATKRRAKSQGDMPEHIDCRERRSMALPSLPLLPQRQGIVQKPRVKVGPTGWSREENSDVRSVIPLGMPRRAAWPTCKTTDCDETVHAPHEGFIPRHHGARNEASNLSGGTDDSGSRATIDAIEAMLEDGGYSYLPACIRDLPEAAVVLGPKPTPIVENVGRGAKGHHSTGAGAARSDRQNKEKVRNAERGDNSGRRAPLFSSSDSKNSMIEDSTQIHAEQTASSRKRGDRAEERFLHPWQRTLKEKKRASGLIAEHEFVLKAEQRRRSEARRTAAASKDCQKARRRIAARLGRHRYNRSNPKGSKRKRDKGMNASRQCKQDDSRWHGPCSTSSKFNIHGKGSHGIVQSMEGNSGDGAFQNYSLDKIGDTLGWAQKTFGAITKHLEQNGVAIENTKVNGQAKEWKVVRLVKETRRHLAAFEDECVTLTMEKSYGTSRRSENYVTPSQSKCNAACDSFEVEFCRLVNELTAVTKNYLTHQEFPIANSEGYGSMANKNNNCKFDTRPAYARSNLVPTGASLNTGRSSFGLCPSCFIDPVARRCLDCEGNKTGRETCASCFVRNHHDPKRRNHHFLPIKGGGHSEVMARKKSDEGSEANEDTANRAYTYNSEVVRCFRCCDLAATRRCRDCSVDMCAACHFLTHRSPSRQGHIMGLVSKTAVTMQHIFHLQNESGKEVRDVADEAEVLVPQDSPISDKLQDGSLGNIRGERQMNGGSFGKDAAHSLAQVRKTLEAPVVRPLIPASLPRVRTPSLDFAGSSDNDRQGFLPEETPQVKISKPLREGSYGDGQYQSNSLDDSEKEEVDGKTVNTELPNGVKAEEHSSTFGSLQDCKHEDGGQNDSDGECVGGFGERLGREDEISKEGEASSGGSSAEEDTDDEGMMWSPANIAKIDLDNLADHKGIANPSEELILVRKTAENYVDALNTIRVTSSEEERTLEKLTISEVSEKGVQSGGYFGPFSQCDGEGRQ